jgi:Ala-tRNA(Pro) deacylase
MTWDAGRERLERDRLLARLLDLGIDAPVVRYPAHTSIEEGKRLRGTLPGTFTKNLLLKDKKGRLFFVTAFEDTDVDLKSLHTRIGAQGRLGFASPDAMAELLHVHPGTATPLGLMNDTENAVTLVVDEALLDLRRVLGQGLQSGVVPSHPEHHVFVARLEQMFIGVSKNPLPLRNSKGVPLFLLCFAASNTRGAKPALRIANHLLRR